MRSLEHAVPGAALEANEKHCVAHAVYTGEETLEKPQNGFAGVRSKDVFRMLVPVAAILASLGLFYGLPNVYPANYEPGAYGIFLFVCLGVYLVFFFLSLYFWKVRKALSHYAWWFLLLVVLLELFDVLTLKTGVLKLPLVPSPDRVISTFCLQISEMAEAFGSSFSLLWLGILIGLATGVVSASLIGWSHFCDYWIMGLLRVIGPIPAAVWIPIAVTIMPSSHAACLFIISLAVWFPLTLMFGSAIRSVEKRYVEAARVLGAKRLQLLFKVAWPAALPAFFDGLFMGLASSFGALVVVEMIGAQSGLGFIINYTRTWAQFDKMLGAAFLLIITFSVMILLFFRVRKRALRWQVGLTKE